MLSKYVLCTRFCGKSAFLTALFGVLLLASCGGRKNVNEHDVANEEVMTDDEWEAEEDTLVYDMPETPLPGTVDESFLDFFYTFLHRRSFQLERVAYPVEVKNEQGEVLETLRNGRSISQALEMADMEYLIMIIGEDSDPYDYLGQDAKHAEIQQVELSNATCRSYAFDHTEVGWKFTGIHYETTGQMEDFVRFYYQFTSDSIFRNEHLAEEILLSIPSTEDEMVMMDGNIDPSQWDVFSPELPKEQLLVLNIGDEEDLHHGVKFVMCSLASSLMEVLCFNKNGNNWKLIKYEQ